MRVRSLPHFSHKPIGKTTHKKGMSYSHVNYITRDDACSKTLAGNMPDDRDGARPFFEREANKEGVAPNARIADTFIIALPLELTREQRHEAIERFMDKIGNGRIAWIAAFHDKGKDEHNPHCHLILRDADIDTGRKVIGTTTSSKDVKEAQERGWKVPPRMTTKDLRVAWCEHLNSEMERHGIDVRFDQRKLKERGIDREPEIHVGPKAHSMSEQERTFFSQDRRRGDHANVYSLLDTGSRAEHNARIRAENEQRERDQQSGGTNKAAPALLKEGQEKKELRERQSTERKALYQEQTLDRIALRRAQDAQKLEHQRWARALYATAREAAYEDVKQRNAAAWTTVHDMKDVKQREAAAADLKQKQKLLYAEVSEKHIEAARPVKDQAWQQLKLDQEVERKDLQSRHTEEVTALSRQHIAERHAVHQKWNAQQQHKRTQRTEAKLFAHQGMATVQTAALKELKQEAQQKRWQAATGIPLSATPREAMQRFAERAKQESNARFAIRYELNSTRRANDNKAWARGGREASPQKTAHARGSAARRQSREQTDRENSVIAGANTGRAVSAADRSNAGADVRSGVAAGARSKRNRQVEHMLEVLQQQRSDKGRDGGGRSGR